MSEERTPQSHTGELRWFISRLDSVLKTCEDQRIYAWVDEVKHEGGRLFVKLKLTIERE